MPDSSLTMRLASLSDLEKPALYGLWEQLFKKEPPPEIRKDLMLRIIAYRLQEQQFGSLNEACSRRLRHIAAALEANPNAAVSSRPPIKPGTRLVRQWKEQVHVVEVEAEGYEYRGARYENLSEIARVITRCTIYTRKSSEEGLEQSFNSLDAQREACGAFIASQRHEGWRALPARSSIHS